MGRRNRARIERSAGGVVLRAIDGVTDVQVLTYLDITKQTYAWGTG